MKELNYTLYPIFLLGFFRVANAVSIGLVIPLYFYGLGYDPTLIGIISSAMSFIYIFAPIFMKKITSKLSKKSSIIISSFVFMIIQLTFQWNLDPYFFLIMRVIEGIFLGIFWPNVGASISMIMASKLTPPDKEFKNRVMKNYSLSWNSGGIFGFIIGTLILFIISDLLLIFDVVLIYSIIGFAVSLIFRNPSKDIEKFDNKNTNIQTDKRDLLSFNVPYMIGLFILIFYGFLGNGFKFLYPITSEELGFPLYSNYFLSFLLNTSQLIFTMKGMKYNYTTIKKLLIISLIMIFAIFFLMIFTQNLILFAIYFILVGFSVSFIYCWSFKIVMYHNATKNTSKYSFYFESTIGFGFFLGPTLAGILADFNLNIAYLSYGFIGLSVLAAFFIIHFKVLKK